MLNFGVRMRSGVLIAVWPLAVVGVLRQLSGSSFELSGKEVLPW